MCLCGLTFVEWIFCTHIPQILLIQRLLKPCPVKALFNLGLLSRLFSLKCGELFWKVGCCLHRTGLLLMSLPDKMVRGGFIRWPSLGSIVWLAKCHESSVARNCRVMLAQETPCLGYLPFITNFSPSPFAGVPLFPLTKLVNMSFPIHIYALNQIRAEEAPCPYEDIDVGLLHLTSFWHTRWLNAHFFVSCVEALRKVVFTFIS